MRSKFQLARRTMRALRNAKRKQLMRLRGSYVKPQLFRIDEDCVCEDCYVYKMKLEEHDEVEDMTVLKWMVCGTGLNGIQDDLLAPRKTSTTRSRTPARVESGRYFGSIFATHIMPSIHSRQRGLPKLSMMYI